MQGGIAQSIGLVLAANARRRGLPTVDWPTGSIYQFCKAVRFSGRPATPDPIADPDQWLDSLPDGFEKAQLIVLARNDPNISDRESIGFANGGPVFISQIVAPQVESWCGQWQVNDPADPDRRIWSVDYRNVPDVPTTPFAQPQEEVRRRLETVLGEAIAFCEQHELGFHESFVMALQALDADAPLADFYHADMIPDGLLSLDHRRIFACAAKAWVFGGMGSWNDMGLEGSEQERYRQISDDLFWVVIGGLVHATNASA